MLTAPAHEAPLTAEKGPKETGAEGARAWPPCVSALAPRAPHARGT